MTLKTTAILVAAIGALGFTAPAYAGTGQVLPPVKRVSYADLDLLTPDGQAELQRRVDRAAAEVCNLNRNQPDRAPRVNGKCFREARQKGQLLVAEVIAKQPLLGG